MHGKSPFVSQEERSARLRRHESQCTICSHPRRLDLQEAWLNWGNTTLLAKDYAVSRDALYRHMHAVGLYEERQKRRKRVYEKILEHTDIIQFTGANIVSILKAYEALCAREESAQAASSPSQEECRPESTPKLEVVAAGASLSGEATSEHGQEGNTVPASEGIPQDEQGAPPVPGQEMSNLESTPAVTVQ